MCNPQKLCSPCWPTSDNTHHREKEHCTAGLLFDWLGFSCFSTQKNCIFHSLAKLDARHTVIISPTMCVLCPIFAYFFFWYVTLQLSSSLWLIKKLFISIVMVNADDRGDCPSNYGTCHNYGLLVGKIKFLYCCCCCCCCHLLLWHAIVAPSTSSQQRTIEGDLLALPSNLAWRGWYDPLLTTYLSTGFLSLALASLESCSISDNCKTHQLNNNNNSSNWCGKSYSWCPSVLWTIACSFCLWLFLFLLSFFLTIQLQEFSLPLKIK